MGNKIQTRLIKIPANPNTPPKINHSFFFLSLVVSLIRFLSRVYYVLIMFSTMCFWLGLPVYALRFLHWVSLIDHLLFPLQSFWYGKCIKTLFLQWAISSFRCLCSFLNIIHHNYGPYRVFHRYKRHFSVRNLYNW